MKYVLILSLGFLSNISGAQSLTQQEVLDTYFSGDYDGTDLVGHDITFIATDDLEQVTFLKKSGAWPNEFGYYLYNDDGSVDHNSYVSFGEFRKDFNPNGTEKIEEGTNLTFDLEAGQKFGFWSQLTYGRTNPAKILSESGHTLDTSGNIDNTKYFTKILSSEGFVYGFEDIPLYDSTIQRQIDLMDRDDFAFAYTTVEHPEELPDAPLQSSIWIMLASGFGLAIKRRLMN